MIESCGPLMSPCLFVGHVLTPVSRSAAGLELSETISLPAAPISLYSKFSTSDVFLALSLGKSAAPLWPWVTPLCCLFLAFLHFFYLFPPPVHRTSQSNLRNLCSCVCLAHSGGLHGGCCSSAINPGTGITERAYCVNYFSKR